MKITDALLRQIDARAHEGFAGPLELACAEFDISEPRERAAFLAQCAIESQGFSRTEENLHYSTAARLHAVFPRSFKTEAEAAGYIGQPARIASRVYAGRNGNGDVASGDGWRFRGRGLIQITGRANYTACLRDLYGDAGVDPDRLLEPDGAARSAAWFWWCNKCGALLASAGFDATTRIINGPGMAGRAERRAAFDKTLSILEAV